MSVIRIVSLLLVLISAIAAQDCQVYFSQQQRQTWATDADTYALYDVLIINTGNSVVSSLTISTSTALDSFWEIQSVGDNYALPEWRALAGGIPVETSHQFGYIVKGGQQAQFNVVACGTPASAPTDEPTAAPTDAPTDAPTEEPTGAPDDEPTPSQAATSKNHHTTEAPKKHTKRPTTAATQKQTKEPTSKATSKPTKEPTSKPTKAPATSKPTKAPTTTKPTTTTTKAPTSKPTSAPSTSGSSGSASGTPTLGVDAQVCSSGSWWAPAPGTTWQWQLTGKIDTSYDVQMYDIDLFDSSAATISTLHEAGRVVICYFSTQYENWRPDSSDFTAAVIGDALDGWQGENYVDIRSTVVRNIMTARMDIAVSKKCDGLEPDNVDGYEAKTGFPLTAADQIDFNSFIAEQAHARGLSVGLKNDVDQSKQLEQYFDWSLNEQCNQYDECNTLDNFISAGKAVFNCEYSGNADNFCPKMNTAGFSSLLKTLDLTAKVKAQCCTYASAGCVAVPAKCVTSVASLVEENDTQLFISPSDQIVEESFDSSAATAYVSATVFVATVALGYILA